MENVYTLKCTQLAPEYKENKEIIEYEDTLEKYESVTSEEYIRSRKRLTDRICSAALPDRLPYNYCIERDDKEQKGDGVHDQRFCYETGDTGLWAV